MCISLKRDIIFVINTLKEKNIQIYYIGEMDKKKQIDNLDKLISKRDKLDKLISKRQKQLRKEQEEPKKKLKERITKIVSSKKKAYKKL